MKTTTRFIKLISSFLFTALIFSGCASTKRSVSNDAVAMNYNLQEGTSYSYLQSSTMVQTIVYMGQEMGSTINTAFGFTVMGTGIEDGLLNIKTTIDTLGISVNSPQGSFTEDMADLKGKQLSFKLTDKGEESNLQEAAKLKYSLLGQETSLKNMFMMLFPDMPDEPIKVGSVWNDSDTIDMSSATESATMIVHSTNTVTGKEKIGAYNCLVINSVLTGSRDSGSDTPQGYIATVGDLTGQGTVYFAPTEGVFVKENAKVKIDGYVNIPTGESLTMIISSENTTELKR